MSMELGVLAIVLEGILKVQEVAPVGEQNGPFILHPKGSRLLENRVVYHFKRFGIRSAPRKCCITFLKTLEHYVVINGCSRPRQQHA